MPTVDPALPGDDPGDDPPPTSKRCSECRRTRPGGYGAGGSISIALILAVAVVAGVIEASVLESLVRTLVGGL